MEDLKKIQEFFSKDINEQTDHVNPMVVKAYKDYIKAKKDSAADIDFAEDPEKAYRYYSRKLNNTYSSKADRDAIEAILKKKYGSAVEESINEGSIEDIQKKLDTLGVKYEMSKTDKVRPFKVIYKPVNKSDEFYDKFEDIVDLYNLKGVIKTSMNEAEKEDAIDTISMDVPLFLRMLEYAREDAQEDVDLHDVTQRVTELSKMKPFLSMEDYNEIVAAPQEIDEEVGFLSLKDDNPFDDVPSIDIQMIDDKEGASSPKAFVNFSSMYHSGDNGKMEILRNNPALQDKVMRMLQSEFQKTFRRVIHGVLGEPFGLNEDAFEDTWALNRRKAQSFIDQYEGNLSNITGVKYAKAYLDIDDIVKANKYWNDFNLKRVTGSVSSMESLKELVKTALMEQKKKRDRCLKIADRKFDKPSAYKSGAVVRCRQGDIWKGLKEAIQEIIQEDESLYKWFKRAGTPGKEGGWVDCNAPIRKDGKITGYKSCGRKKGEQRAKYPSCRPTAAKCKDPGKGTKWGKTK